MTLSHSPDSEAEDDAAAEPAPDSGALRVSQRTLHESGIPPARDSLARAASGTRAASGAAETLDQLELVLVESTRAEANLGLLIRGLSHLANGAGAAREANTLLMQELEGLRVRVSKVYENEAILEKRVETLENALDSAARERDSWFEQEDAFLAGLLTEHEQELERLRREQERRLADFDDTVAELRAQRDSSRTEVARLIYERDAAIALLNEPIASTERAPSSSPPPSSVTPATALGSVKLNRVPLKEKPSAASRPLIGYAVSGEEVTEELLEGSQISARSPRS